mmetsp:Transcript_14302/g.32001  ORF Transcript_14302/g.32001 Transcript_14302/m.32001 type:complete len:230 (+) Transcript_14302:304-993(+)
MGAPPTGDTRAGVRAPCQPITQRDAPCRLRAQGVGSGVHARAGGDGGDRLPGAGGQQGGHCCQVRPPGPDILFHQFPPRCPPIQGGATARRLEQDRERNQPPPRVTIREGESLVPTTDGQDPVILLDKRFPGGYLILPRVRGFHAAIRKSSRAEQQLSGRQLLHKRPPTLVPTSRRFVHRAATPGVYCHRGRERVPRWRRRYGCGGRFEQRRSERRGRGRGKVGGRGAG